MLMQIVQLHKTFQFIAPALIYALPNYKPPKRRRPGNEKCPMIAITHILFQDLFSIPSSPEKYTQFRLGLRATIAAHKIWIKDDAKEINNGFSTIPHRLMSDSIKIVGKTCTKKSIILRVVLDICDSMQTWLVN